MRRLALLPFLSLALACAFAACTAPPAPGLGTERGQVTLADSPTGGFAFRIEWRDTIEFRFERFELDANGEFRTGGGQVAMLHGTDWGLRLSPSDAARLAALARGLPPIDGAALAVEPTPGRMVELEWWSPGVHERRTFDGLAPALEPLRTECRALGLRRFRPVLDALPEAGPRQP